MEYMKEYGSYWFSSQFLNLTGNLVVIYANKYSTVLDQRKCALLTVRGIAG